MLMINTKVVGKGPGFKKATQEDLDKIKELIADCYELLPIMKGE